MTQTIYKSDKAEYPSLHPAVSASQAGVTFSDKAEASLDDSLAADDLVLMHRLPANHELVAFSIEADELDDDGTPTIKLDVGYLNDDEDDLIADNRILDDDDLAQAGGFKRMDETGGLWRDAESKDRWITVKVRTVAAGKKAGKVKSVLQYSAKQ